MPKLTWKVQDKPTGRYSCFFRRGWPTGWNVNNHPIASIKCTDDYVPSKAKAADHKPLKVSVAIKNNGKEIEEKGTFTWRTLKGEFKTLQAAKEAAEKFYNDHPELFLD